jgi:hypothetical protein
VLVGVPRLLRLALLILCCHVIDRVSHGLTPFGFQTSQFDRSAGIPRGGVRAVY